MLLRSRMTPLPSLAIPPPVVVDVLFAIVLFVMVIVPVPVLRTPPPLWGPKPDVELLLMVLLVMLITPWLVRATAPPPETVDELLLTVLFKILTVASTTK